MMLVKTLGKYVKQIDSRRVTNVLAAVFGGSTGVNVLTLTGHATLLKTGEDHHQLIRQMKRPIHLLPALFVCALAWGRIAQAADSPAGFYPEGLAALYDTLRKPVYEGRIPCVVALLDRPGRGEHCFIAGARDISTGDPVRRDTIFAIYSLTKMMTAAGALCLVEEGKMNLDDPVEKFLPELANRRVWVGGDAPATETVPAQSPPTIRQLLTHTAGYYYDTTADGPLRDIARSQNDKVFLTAAEFLDFIAQWPLHDQPGARYRYSNGYAILGLVMERAAGQSLEEILQSRLLRPLGMTDTSFLIPEEKRGRVARICRRDAQGRLFIDAASEARLPARGTFYAGGGDLFSTADDLVRFGRMLLNGGELDGRRVLSAESVRQMTSDQLGGLPIPAVDYMARDTIGFGTGIAIRDSDLGNQGAFGWTGNASTLLQINPKANLVAVVLSQVRPGDKDLYREFLRAAYIAINAPPANRPNP